MIELIYQVLEKIGYAHPIHPPLTHIPPFPPQKISDTQALKLYQYISKVLEKSKSKQKLGGDFINGKHLYQ
jgi:hypothetical protein